MTKRILHVVGGMNRGGVETWLMHVLRNIDRTKFQMDFLVHTNQLCSYDDEIRALGSRIIPCLHPANPRLYAFNFNRILRENEPYDVIHSHVHHFSGYVLRLAYKAGIPKRIAQSHSSRTTSSYGGVKRLLYLKLMRLWIWKYATVGFGVSKESCSALWGVDWNQDPRWHLLYYGIDLTTFQSLTNRSELRAQFDIPENAFVIGHVGRFQEVKNHRFLIQLASDLVRHMPDIRLFLVGEGPLRSSIEQQVKDAHLDNHVIFAGLRSDVPHLLLGVIDIFVMPSIYEGLPLVLIEAQSAGIPCIITDVITEEIEVIKTLFQRHSLSESVNNWTQTILATKQIPPPISQFDALKIMIESSFNIQTNLQQLEKIYCE